MHQIVTGPSEISKPKPTLRLVGVSESPDGYVACIESYNPPTRLSKTVKSIALDESLIALLEPKDALQIGFWLGIESS